MADSFPQIALAKDSLVKHMANSPNITNEKTDNTGRHTEKPLNLEVMSMCPNVVTGVL